MLGFSFLGELGKLIGEIYILWKWLRFFVLETAHKVWGGGGGGVGSQNQGWDTYSFVLIKRGFAIIEM